MYARLRVNFVAIQPPLKLLIFQYGKKRSLKKKSTILNNDIIRLTFIYRLALQRAWEYVLSTYRNEDEPNAYKDMILRSFKLLFYIVLVLVLIVGVVVTRGSLQILASQLGNHSRIFQHV